LNWLKKKPNGPWGEKYKQEDGKEIVHSKVRIGGAEKGG